MNYFHFYYNLHFSPYSLRRLVSSELVFEMFSKFVSLRGISQFLLKWNRSQGCPGARTQAD